MKLLEKEISAGTYVTDPVPLGRMPDSTEYLSVFAKFVGGPTVASAYTLVNDVATSASVVNCIITDTTASITSGKVRVIGLESVSGESLTEDVDISAGAGTYPTTALFTEITAIYAFGCATLGGSGDETIEVQWDVDSAVIVAETNLVEPTADFNVFVQTTLDEGTTWCDIMNFHFTTFNASKIHAIKLSTALAANITPTDGGSTANSILSGLLGNKLRLKYLTTDAYVGASISLYLVTR